MLELKLSCFLNLPVMFAFLYVAGVVLNFCNMFSGVENGHFYLRTCSGLCNGNWLCVRQVLVRCGLLYVSIDALVGRHICIV
jgi:hypothetical protein